MQDYNKMINNSQGKKILITGSAGFIGFHLTTRLIKDCFEVIGLDNLNEYYDVNLKFARLFENGINASELIENEIVISNKFSNYKFLKADISNHDFIVEFMKIEKFDYVVNLAAQAGVRYSIENPRAYTKSNIDGFLSILEGSRHSNVKHLLYASTSSVYGLNEKMPLSETQPTEHPIALYGATKKANEMMAHSYSHLFKLPTTGLRFFTVYGPWGRPDMALFLFTNAILNNSPIKVFNFGKMLRDFTYVDDIVESITRLILKPAQSDINWDGTNPKISTSSAPYQIFNIGNSSPVTLLEYIESLENALNKKAIKELIEMQPGDVPGTHADTDGLQSYINFKPNTSIDTGILNFVNWYKNWYLKK
jgi:UDP-glucuronate 4-epimerase